jgi:hypothetical protein
MISGVRYVTENTIPPTVRLRDTSNLFDRSVPFTHVHWRLAKEPYWFVSPYPRAKSFGYVRQREAKMLVGNERLYGVSETQ